MRHGGRLASRASTWPGDHFWRSTRPKLINQEKTMSKNPKRSQREELVKTTSKGKIELTEAELSRVSGGIKLGDIKGETIDDKHKDWIEVLSYRT
jgi:hypothetical protein